MRVYSLKMSGKPDALPSTTGSPGELGGSWKQRTLRVFAAVEGDRFADVQVRVGVPSRERLVDEGVAAVLLMNFRAFDEAVVFPKTCVRSEITKTSLWESGSDAVLYLFPVASQFFDPKTPTAVDECCKFHVFHSLPAFWLRRKIAAREGEATSTKTDLPKNPFEKIGHQGHLNGAVTRPFWGQCSLGCIDADVYT